MHHQVHCSCWLALIDSVQRIGCGSPLLSVSDPSETMPLASLTRLESASRCMKCYERQHLSATASCNSLVELNAPFFFTLCHLSHTIAQLKIPSQSDSSNLKELPVCLHSRLVSNGLFASLDRFQKHWTPTGRTRPRERPENEVHTPVHLDLRESQYKPRIKNFDTWKSHSMSWKNISSRENHRKSKISWKHRFGRPLSLTCFENCQNLSAFSARCQVQSFANTLVFVYVFLGDGWVSLRLFLKLHYKMPNISGRVRFNFAVRPWGICQYLSWRTLKAGQFTSALTQSKICRWQTASPGHNSLVHLWSNANNTSIKLHFIKEENYPSEFGTLHRTDVLHHFCPCHVSQTWPSDNFRSFSGSSTARTWPTWEFYGTVNTSFACFNMRHMSCLTASICISGCDTCQYHSLPQNKDKNGWAATKCMSTSSTREVIVSCWNACNVSFQRPWKTMFLHGVKTC